MQVSAKGAGFIVSAEGLYLYAYPDAGRGWKVPTIGGGHTTAAGGLVVRQGMTITLAQACAILMDDLNRNYGPRVNRAITRRLVQNVFDGFLSFDFNTGAILSGSVDDKWNRGDEAAAIAALRQYVNAAGKRLAGLETRRISEAKIISDGQYPSAFVQLRTSPNAAPRMVQASSLPWGTESGPPMQIAPSAFAHALTVPLAPPPTRDSVWVRLWQWWKSEL